MNHTRLAKTFTWYKEWNGRLKGCITLFIVHVMATELGYLYENRKGYYYAWRSVYEAPCFQGHVSKATFTR
jgi:hypothetical protein